MAKPYILSKLDQAAYNNSGKLTDTNGTAFLETPTSDNDATNKSYVDNKLSASNEYVTTSQSQ